MNHPGKTIAATDDDPAPLPPHGGNWQRLPDGSLALVEQTLRQEEADEASPVNPQE